MFNVQNNTSKENYNLLEINYKNYYYNFDLNIN